MKKAIYILFLILAIVLSLFLFGRYGWKLFGFSACQGAGIQSVEVRTAEGNGTVHIEGFYPGSFSKGFCGYVARQQGNTLYVGFRFSALFGFFETGTFDITIPVKGVIHQVVLKTSTNETPLWSAGTGFLRGFYA